MKITLLYGGRNIEHEISILSAFSILNATYYSCHQIQLVFITKEGQWVKGLLLAEKPASKDILHLSWDPDGQTGKGFTGRVINPGEIKEEGAIVFPVLYGPNGEDGTIQDSLETLNMPCINADVLTGACVMDRTMTKYILQAAGALRVPYIPVPRDQWRENPRKVFDQYGGSLLRPMSVKPANMGSSVDIAEAENREELQSALTTAYQCDSRAIVEQGIETRRIEATVLGDGDVWTTLPDEVVKDVASYDYGVRYTNNKVEMQTPAEVPEEAYQKVQEYAKLAYTMLGGNRLSRCNFFLTNRSELFLNELNSIPGFTEFSIYPPLWESIGSKYGNLIEELIQLRMNRYHQRQSFFGKNE